MLPELSRSVPTVSTARKGIGNSALPTVPFGMSASIAKKSCARPIVATSATSRDAFASLRTTTISVNAPANAATASPAISAGAYPQCCLITRIAITVAVSEPS
jgi:hypothetical protein